MLAVRRLISVYLQSGWCPTFHLADTFLVTGCIVLALALAITADETGHQVSPRGDLSG